MVIAAQGLLALIPLMVVLVAFLPDAMTEFSIERFTDVTGVGEPGSEAAQDAVDVDEVRTHTGVIGIMITLLSATSFARAVERLYERVWQLPHVGGLVGTRRCFLWLVAWIIAQQAVTLLGFTLDTGPGFGAVAFVIHVAAGTAVWLWTMRVLLFGRVPWRHLLAGAVLTALLMACYSAVSSVVMPPYVSENVAQFGTLGLVLALATWLIGFAAVMVVAGVIGRVLTEDQSTRELAIRVTGRSPNGH